MATIRFMSSKRDSIKVMKMKSNGARETPRFLFQAFLLKRRRRRGGKNQRNQNDSESKKEGMKLNIGVEIRGSSWIASDHRSQRSCSELSNPGFLTHTCNIHRDIFAFRHRRRDAIRCLPRYYVAGIARFLVHFFFSSFFFFYTFRNRSCRIEFQRWNIFIPRRESRNLILNREQAAWKKT